MSTNNDSIVSLENLIKRNAKIQREYLDVIFTTADDLLQRCNRIFNEDERLNYSDSHQFNLFKFFRIGETLHSRILADILNPNGDHGQGYTFLTLFLKALNFKEDELAGNWRVTAEQGRIDVLIRRDHPHTVIVIENKSHNAIDQPSQLYRYWYWHMWPTLKAHSFDINANLPKPNYHLIYLSPNPEKIPSDLSTRKDSGIDEQGLPDRIPKSWITHWIFKDQITDWLTMCVAGLSNNNSRYREFLNQYIEIIQTLH